MKEAEQLTDVIAVQYPSNHSFVAGLKILFVGKKSQWKQDITDAFVEYITDTPLTFFYIDEDEYDTDKVSWLYNNLLHCDYRIMYVSNDIEDLSIIGPHIKDEKTYLMFDKECKDSIQSMYSILNPNKITDDIRSIVLSIKTQCAK